MVDEVQLLKEKLSSLKEISEEKIDTMNRLSSLLLTPQPKEASIIAQRAIMEARAIEYIKGEALALVNAGVNAAAQRQFSDAEDFYKSALKIFEQENDEVQIATVLAKLGNVNLFEGKYGDALGYYNRAIPIREKLNDELGVADLHANSGIIQGLTGNYPLALKSHLAALKTFEKLNQLSRVASSSTNIGIIYYEQHNYEEALAMYERALIIRKEAENTKEVSGLMNNMGNVFHDQGKFIEAKQMHELALELRKQLDDKAKVATSLSNLGDVYKGLGDYTTSLDYYSKALHLFEELNEKRGLVPSYYNLGELYFMQGNFKEAHRFLSSAIKLAEETGLRDHLREAYQDMAKIFAEWENFEEAYRLQLRFIALDKEISNTETSRMMAQLTMRNEIEQKERAAEIEREKNTELTKAYNALDSEKQRSENLLLNILPMEVAEELKQNGKATAKHFDNVTVFFSDFVGFTKVSMLLSPQELVDELHECFKGFDEIISKYSIEKIKTVGDAYLAASGLPIANKSHALDIVCAAREIRDFMLNRKKRLGEKTFEVRIGIHSGSVVAGIVGVKKFAYDIWGDTVNTAARMEQNSVPGRINISESTHELLARSSTFVGSGTSLSFEYRGEIEAKNKGKLKMYFVA